MDNLVKHNGTKLTRIDLTRQTIISGPLSASLKLTGHETATRWPGMAKGNAYAISLRRDRILVVNGPELNEGWNDNSALAISDMSGAYAVLELAGPNALQLLNQGTELDPATPSGSAMRNFHGFEIILYPHQSETTYRLHIPRSHVGGLWNLLTGFFDNQ